ncbi:hypothetical protein [Streptomyces bungoensis]|uniref:hypothetical protein n=1 Tax=Streptomyces bungoensis TaxID=285568 RepID=UPI00342F60B6
MADEHDKWLNRETAERLLRGESLEAVDAAARDQAERLAEALGALSAQAAPATGELPGEQSALAAFRKAREAAEAERTAAALGDGTPGSRSGASARGTDAGLVRIGAGGRSGIRARRPRWARPVRLALAAAVAAGTLGGVAMAAGGILPLPFHDEHPAPAASVSADPSPGRPLTSPSAPAPEGLAPGAGTPEAGTGGTPGGGPSGDAPGTTPGAPGASRQEAGAACRDIRDGKELGAGRRRALEGLAGGPARVTAYCKSVLAGQYTAGGQNGNGNITGGQDGDKSGGGNGGGKSTGTGTGAGKGKGKDKDKGTGSGQGGDDDTHRGLGDGKGKGQGEGKGHGRDGGSGGGGPQAGAGNGSGGHRPNGVTSPAPTRLAPPARGRGASAPMPAPSPSYTAS